MIHFLTHLFFVRLSVCQSFRAVTNTHPRDDCEFAAMDKQGKGLIYIYTYKKNQEAYFNLNTENNAFH